MTKAKQDKTATPAAVELNDAALDRAVGGGKDGPQSLITVQTRSGVGSVNDGTSNTLTGIDYGP